MDSASFILENFWSDDISRFISLLLIFFSEVIEVFQILLQFIWAFFFCLNFFF